MEILISCIALIVAIWAVCRKTGDTSEAAQAYAKAAVDTQIRAVKTSQSARALGTGGIAAEALGNRREGELLRQILEELKLIKEELKTCEKSRTTN